MGIEHKIFGLGRYYHLSIPRSGVVAAIMGMCKGSFAGIYAGTLHQTALFNDGFVPQFTSVPLMEE